MVSVVWNIEGKFYFVLFSFCDEVENATSNARNFFLTLYGIKSPLANPIVQVKS